MGERTINSMRRKFTWTAFLSFFIVMLLLGGLIYLVNYHSSEVQIRATLNYIVENKGDISKNAKIQYPREQDNDAPINDIINDVFRTGVDSAPQFRFYFAILYDENGMVTSTKTGNINLKATDEMISYGQKILNKGREYGTMDNYYYQLADIDDGKIVVCLDCSANIANTTRILNITLVIIGLGAVISFFILRLLSAHVVSPEIRAAERQQQFITNAGHELKTPLAVIRANTELDMMINGENDWNKSTISQVDHMTKLIQDLITIARAEESEKEDILTDTDVSQIVTEAADAFASVAMQNGKTLEKDIAENIHMVADKDKIHQLVTILTDNAIKYCDEKGSIRITLSSKGRIIRLCVYNDYTNKEELDFSRFFERFYRADKSHNIDKGGYGIGLSIAESIVKRYKGSIEASHRNNVICFTCTLRS